MAPTTTRRGSALIAACIVSTIALVALDIGTKTWAENALSAERTGERPEVCASDEDGYIRYQRARRPGLVVIEDVFELEYAENCGAAFGLLRNAPTALRTTIFGIAATAATIVLLWLFIQGRGGPWFAWSVPFVVSGALGNLIDRIRYGYVVDFIHWHWRDEFDYPTFNVADIAITIGVVLLLIDGFRREEPAKVDEKAAPAAKTKTAEGAGDQRTGDPREAAGE
ncbi:signal peptidase II [Sandaracinus amylolyticus]|uniref:signal peptidase II n=1 Tax=Sandaracinus amylolyticus TaxID=927083 RepID=UPI001F03270B|nr:signal peptidase II [Sandaracinus amylolyticus]UJR80818.1 Lipoprotein signal peptidase [Sandaracinus amylolyticus]